MAGYVKMPPPLLPINITLNNYTVLFPPIVLRWLANTIIAVTASTILALTVAGLAGYTFSLHRFPGKSILWWAFLTSILVSRYALLVPMYVSIRLMGLRGLLAVILSESFWCVGIYLTKAYIDTIPRELCESARLDGAGEAKICFRVVLPICKPLVGLLIISKIIPMITDYIWQAIVLHRTEEQTLIVGMLSQLYHRRFVTQNMFLVNYGEQLSTAVILFIPLVAIFSFASRYFLEDLTMGSLK